MPTKINDNVDINESIHSEVSRTGSAIVVGIGVLFWFRRLYNIQSGISRVTPMLVPTSARVYQSNVGMMYLKVLSGNIGFH